MAKFNKFQMDKFQKFFKVNFISFLFLCASAFYYFNNVDETLKLFKISQFTGHILVIWAGIILHMIILKIIH